MNPIIALAADMIFASKIRGTAQSAGAPLILARNASHLAALANDAAARPSLILLDLDTRGLDITATIASLRSAAPDAPVIAFVSHTATDRIREAQRAGARVLARSAFVAQLPSLLTPPGAPPSD